MAETSGMAEIRTSYPKTSGLTAGTTKQKGRKTNLTPLISSLVPARKKVGF